MEDEPRVLLGEVLAGRRGRFLIALLLAEFGAAMQGIAYSTVLPVIAQELDGFDLFGATLAAGTIAAVAMLSVAPIVLARFRPGMVLLVATALYVVGVGVATVAPDMVWVLAGVVVRGVAAGLLAGFGMGAIGALFDERSRPRVFGLFALIWLLPSFVGPALNALIAEWAGWRWALVWPAVLVLAARALMGRYVSAVPWTRGRPRARPLAGLIVTALLAAGAWGSAAGPGAGSLVFGVSVVGAAAAGYVFLRAAAPRARRALVTFALLCAAYFGLYELLALTVVEGLEGSVVWAAVALSGGLIAWTVMGLRPRPHARVDRVMVGTSLVLVALIVLIAAMAYAESAALAVVIAGAVVAGLGMGMAYPLLSSEPFEDGEATTTGALVAFAETAGTAWSALLGGGLYSLLHVSGTTPRTALLIVLPVLGVVAAGAVTAAIVRRRGRSVTHVDAEGDGEISRER